MTAPSFLHFGSPAENSPQSLVDAEMLALPEGPKSILINDTERATGRDRAMTYAVSIAKEGETTAEKLVADSKTIYEYLYTEESGSATAA